MIKADGCHGGPGFAAVPDHLRPRPRLRPRLRLRLLLRLLLRLALAPAPAHGTDHFAFTARFGPLDESRAGLVNKRPKQFSAHFVHRSWRRQPIEIPGHVPDQQAAHWQRARPSIQMRLEQTLSVCSLNAPLSDLYLFFYRKYARHFKNETGLGKGELECLPGFGRQHCRILYKQDLPVCIIPERQMASRF